MRLLFRADAGQVHRLVREGVAIPQICSVRGIGVAYACARIDEYATAIVREVTASGRSTGC
jgi:hypothetical protein